MPATEEEWLAITYGFENKWNFPHAIGTMDGKHVVLESPINSGNDYDNYKQFPSIVLFALVDENYKFLYVNVGSKGRISDGGLFKNTKLYENLEKRELGIPSPKILQMPSKTEVPFFILGDEAFQLNENTIKPYEGTPERGSMERIASNESCLSNNSSIQLFKKKPCKLPALRTTRIFDTVGNDGERAQGSWRNEPAPTSLLPLTAIPRRPTIHAKQVRDHLARHFISNGVIAWQNNYQ
ncbi:unnamed protein product [Euphydryas editha]|uniref:DDE Tnp4 domain-containing protein n=1 Tax=Euphydryas editha TaxID=104508 RepID=A0AAU9TR17_EUPED|nr:unnamed protein product [Euphydryas editha]